MKLTVITDNNVAVEGFRSEWGFACMIGDDFIEIGAGTVIEI